MDYETEKAIAEIKTLIGDNTPTKYMAELIKKVEEDEIALRKAEINLGLLKQMNNRARILVQATSMSKPYRPTPCQSGLAKYLIDTLDPNKRYRYTDILNIGMSQGYGLDNGKSTITRLVRYGCLRKDGKHYIFTNDETIGTQNTPDKDNCECVISKSRILKLLYLVYPNLNVSKLADAIGVKQPAVHAMIFK